MFDSKAPLARALELRGLGWAAKVVTVGSLFGLTATTFTGLLGQPRIFYSMARDVSGCVYALCCIIIMIVYKLFSYKCVHVL